ncbi:MAG: RNA polymerase sigma-70 factor [Bacteroidota bacterium]|nr:RNA polymerase sigma-70 factor [Bacteroidota bacterium]
MTTPEDHLIVPAIREGDAAAFEQLFHFYYAPLCRYAGGIVTETEDAEEIVQQVFLRIWERRKELNITVSFKAYLYRSVHNASLNHKQRRRKDVRLNDGPLRIVHAAEASHEMDVKQLEEEISKALKVLPEQCRKIFELSRFEELKYREIAELLDISVKTVENQMGKALRIMRERLSAYLPFLIFTISHGLFYLIPTS